MQQPRRDEAGLGPQILPIAQPRQSRVVHAPKQPLGHRVDGGPPALVELMRDGADDMIGLAGQPPGLLTPQPALDLQPRTWRAQAVATRVLPEALDMPLWTRLDVSTQHGGATRQHRPHRSTHMVGQRVAALIGRIAHV
jgi:hypothetical protein